MDFHPNNHIDILNPGKTINDTKTALRRQITDSASLARKAAGLGMTEQALDSIADLVDAATRLDRLHQADTTILDATVTALALRLADATGHPTNGAL